MEESQQLFAAGGYSTKRRTAVGDDYTAGDFFDSVSFRGVSWRQMTTCCQTA